MKSNIQLIDNTPDDRDRWDDFVDRTAKSSIYHYSKWRNIIENVFGHKTFYLYSTDDRGNVAGILPLVNLKSVLFGNMLVSMPYFNYGGVCADNDGTRDLLINEAIVIAKEIHSNHIEFRQEASFDNGFPIKTTKVSMLLDLPSSADDLWKSFPSKLRSQLKKPQKEGLFIRIGGEEELDSFYKVFSTNMRDLGTPVYPKRFFRQILKNFEGNTWIVTACKETEPVASGFLIGFKGKMEIPWASSLRRFNRISPNMLLYWNCLKFSCEQGYKVFDFGRSSKGEGSYKFKEQWGANPRQLYWHYWMREGVELPEINPSNRKYNIAIHCWKKLPVPVTKFLGPFIVKNIP